MSTWDFIVALLTVAAASYVAGFCHACLKHYKEQDEFLSYLNDDDLSPWAWGVWRRVFDYREGVR